MVAAVVRSKIRSRGSSSSILISTFWYGLGYVMDDRER